MKRPNLNDKETRRRFVQQQLKLLRSVSNPDERTLMMIRELEDAMVTLKYPDRKKR